jgi:hypothetical protein
MTCPYITCSSILHPSPCTATSTSYSTANFKPQYPTGGQTWTPAGSSQLCPNCQTCRSILCPNCQSYRSTLCPNCQIYTSTLCPNCQICRSTLSPNCQTYTSILSPNCQTYKSILCQDCQMCTTNFEPELSDAFIQPCLNLKTSLSPLSQNCYMISQQIN